MIGKEQEITVHVKSIDDIHVHFARVLLERPDNEAIQRAKKSGLVLPDSVQGKYKPPMGRVIKIGPNVDDSIKGLVGKIVFVARFAGDDIKVGDKTLFICQDEDILVSVQDDW